MSKRKPPREGWTKINVDGTYDADTGVGGIGVVIRDDKGAVMLTAWKFIDRGAGCRGNRSMGLRRRTHVSKGIVPG